MNKEINAWGKIMNKAKLLNSFMPVVLLTVATLALPEYANAEMPLNPPTAPLPNVGKSELRVKETTTAPGVATVPKLRLLCRPSQFGNLDPIVFPGVSGAGHHHTFFGNTGITPDSTTDSISVSGNTTCAGGIANRSAYWVPSMYNSLTGKIVSPKQIIVYYTTPKILRLTVKPVPKGLKMISGTHTNTTIEEAKGNFHCSAWPSPSYGTGKTIPVCLKGNLVRGAIGFPSCWNGVDLDSADHKSHMSFPRVGNWRSNPAANECPTSHPIRIPTVTFVADWGLSVDGESANWRLSSDMYGADQPGGLSFHGDYMEGWQTKFMNMIVNNCLKADKDCGMGLLGKDPKTGKLLTVY